MAQTHIISRQRLANISYFLIWVIYSTAQSALLWSYGYNLEFSINDSIISASVLTIACFTMTNALRYYLPSRKHYIYIVIWALVLSASSIAIARVILRIAIESEDYLRLVDSTIPLRVCFQTLIIAWIATINILRNIQQEHKENEQRKIDAERMSREAELYNLRQQLQPHFLFNSLNSIVALISKEPDRAREMTFQLSDFLRGTLKSDDQQLIPLKEELNQLKLYLDIEKVRFGHRLETHIETEAHCEHLLLPAMILQPLLENAIKFGLYDSARPAVITIKIRCESDQMLHIEIQNPYNPNWKISRKGTGFGINSIRRRLFLLFGRTDLLQTEGDEQRFTSTISIPQLKQPAP